MESHETIYDEPSILYTQVSSYITNSNNNHDLGDIHFPFTQQNFQLLRVRVCSRQTNGKINADGIYGGVCVCVCGG